jgi:hypothetical protein
MKEQLEDALTNSMHMFLLCECCLQPQPQSSSTSQGNKKKVWPLKIRTPRDKVPPLLPLARVAFKAALVANGVSQVGRLFGLPTPVLPQDTLQGARNFISKLGNGSASEFQELQNRFRELYPSGGGEANMDFCMELFARFLQENDPVAEWRNLLSRRYVSCTRKFHEYNVITFVELLLTVNLCLFAELVLCNTLSAAVGSSVKFSRSPDTISRFLFFNF